MLAASLIGFALCLLGAPTLGAQVDKINAGPDKTPQDLSQHSLLILFLSLMIWLWMLQLKAGQMCQAANLSLNPAVKKRASTRLLDKLLLFPPRSLTNTFEGRSMALRLAYCLAKHAQLV